MMPVADCDCHASDNALCPVDHAHFRINLLCLLLQNAGRFRPKQLALGLAKAHIVKRPGDSLQTWWIQWNPSLFLPDFQTKSKPRILKVSMPFTTPTYPGINLEANEGPQTNAVAIVFIVLSFITLVLRFISRLNTHVSIELDDWLIVVAAVRPY